MAAATDIDGDFIAFHHANPHVYDLLVNLARQAKASGQSRIGMGILWEQLRWKTVLRTTGYDFKLNNNYRSRYSRLIMHREADLAGFITTRKLHT